MSSMTVEIRKPVALWHEIRELIATHYKVAEDTSFMKWLPEVYHLYLTLSSKGKWHPELIQQSFVTNSYQN